jgi:hypothetical protein
MAMYQPHSQQALLFLAKSEDALRERKNVMPGLVQQEFAQILRARVELATKLGDGQMADSTLAELAELSVNSDDRLIESTYDGAAEALLFSGHDYEDAALHLQEDIRNPFSLKLLAIAYQKIGESAEAVQINDTLANFNDPTLEQAMIVPEFRKCIRNPLCEDSIQKASSDHRKQSRDTQTVRQ